MNKPIAVLISDVHYNLQTLQLADKAMRMAIDKANSLNVSLIVAGDLHDTKANLRGECVNAMLETFKQADIPPYVIVGNHDKINEKSIDHSLNFLSKYCDIVDTKRYDADSNIHLFPYFSSQEDFNRHRSSIPFGETIICHQGLSGSNMGDYIQDKTAIISNDVAGLRVISGHYHNRQTIDLPNGGKWDYIGNPYTLSFGEASDPEKGFQILYDDGSLKFVPTNLRRHIVVEESASVILDSPKEAYRGLCDKDDSVWFKITGNKDRFKLITREFLSNRISSKNIKLTYEGKTEAKVFQHKNLTQNQILDNIINNLNESNEKKAILSQLWKQLCE